MSASARNWLQYALTLLSGIAFSVFDRRAELIPYVRGWWSSAAPVLVPLGYTAIGFSLGYATCRRVTIEKQKSKCEVLRRFFLSARPRMRAAVSYALDNGSVRLSAYDTDASILCHNGIFGTAPFGFRSQGLDYSIQPRVIEEIIAHRREWLGDMTPERAIELLEETS